MQTDIKNSESLEICPTTQHSSEGRICTPSLTFSMTSKGTFSMTSKGQGYHAMITPGNSIPAVCSTDVENVTQEVTQYHMSPFWISSAIATIAATPPIPQKEYTSPPVHYQQLGQTSTSISQCATSISTISTSTPPI